MYSNIFYDGREAFRNEISEEDNPYEEGSSEFYQWADGWLDAFGFVTVRDLRNVSGN